MAEESRVDGLRIELAFEDDAGVVSQAQRFDSGPIQISLKDTTNVSITDNAVGEAATLLWTLQRYDPVEEQFSNILKSNKVYPTTFENGDESAIYRLAVEAGDNAGLDSGTITAVQNITAESARRKS